MKVAKIYRKSFIVPSLRDLWKPLKKILIDTPELNSRCNKPLAMNIEELLQALVYFHLQEHSSGRELIQTLQEDEFAKDFIAPEGGIKRATFFETINERGLEQFQYIFEQLQKQAASVLPKQHPELGDLVAIDGSLIDAVLSMHWADYRKGAKKARLHLGFDVNRSIPQKLYLTNGKGAERPHVSRIIEPGQTSVLDRGYQDHHLFDQWQEDDQHFICRIKKSTCKNVLEAYPVPDDSKIFFDAKVTLGSVGNKQTAKPVRLVGYRIDGKEYWIATDRFDLTAEQVATAYKLRWEIETFFGWWKRHLHVYHLIARSEHGLMMQILAGLITYLLLAIYCHEQHGERVSIKRVRQLRNQILNEIRQQSAIPTSKRKRPPKWPARRKRTARKLYAKV